MLKYKPLSPHLTIYKTENFSLYSIWHRITGIINLFVLTFILLLSKLFIWGINFQIWKFLFVYKQYLFILIFTSFLYHMFNGCRHILWDLNIFLTIASAKKSSYVLIWILCIFLLNWIIIL